MARQQNYAEAFHNRGVALRQLQRLEEAVHSYRKAIAIRPGYAEAFNHLGESLRQLNQLQEALQSCETALAIQPNFAEALNNRAIVLLALHRLEEALRSCDGALAIRPDFANALATRGYILQDFERHEEAAASFRVAMKLDPEHEYALGSLIYSAVQACDWSEYAQQDSLSACIQASRRVALPFVLTAVSASPQEQYLCSKILVAHRCPPAPAPIWRGEQYKHAKIRLAYLSADFHDHATAFLMAGLFEHHDATRFETTAVSFGTNTRSDMRSRLERAFERFIDVRNKSDREVATMLRELEIDIAVDLKGFTADSRTGIFAHRPAPIQVNYLGYPGTMGADYIDYILADRYVIPEEHHAYYMEKVVYLPDTYQVNDRKRRIAERTPTRGEAGLPDRGFVFCSFNRNYKITPPVFDIWMRLLREVDGSVLWLLAGNASAPNALRREAMLRGVAPERLVFAARAELADHLARHRLADLFLDTLPYNAHTTASDALWAGLPVLTCLGTTFAGRVAGRLLNAIGLPELITHSLQEYEALAFKLATDGKTLSEIKQQLARNRETFPLFDTDRFRRHIEAAYLSMWERYQGGQTPASFAVDPIDQ